MFFFSCDRILEQNQYKNEQSQYTSPYKGIWMGNYEGGTFKLEVYKSGNIEVTRYFGNSSEVFYGQVLDDGALQSVFSTSSNFRMYGSLSTKKGTWNQNNTSGNWTVAKQ